MSDPADHDAPAAGERVARALDKFRWERENNSHHRTATLTDDTLDEIDDIVANSLAALRANPTGESAGWCDIASAPKDGTQVRLRRDGFPLEDCVSHWGMCDGPGGSQHGRMAWTYAPKGWKPTHWQPLAAAPSPRPGEDAGERVDSAAAANWTRAMKAESRVEWLEAENKRLRASPTKEQIEHLARAAYEHRNWDHKQPWDKNPWAREAWIACLSDILTTAPPPAPLPEADGELIEQLRKERDEALREKAAARGLQQGTALILAQVEAQRDQAVAERDDALKVVEPFANNLVIDKNPLGPIGAYGTLRLAYCFGDTTYTVAVAQNSYDEATLNEIASHIANARALLAKHASTLPAPLPEADGYADLIKRLRNDGNSWAQNLFDEAADALTAARADVQAERELHIADLRDLWEKLDRQIDARKVAEDQRDQAVAERDDALKVVEEIERLTDRLRSDHPPGVRMHAAHETARALLAKHAPPENGGVS